MADVAWAAAVEKAALWYPSRSAHPPVGPSQPAHASVAPSSHASFAFASSACRSCAWAADTTAIIKISSLNIFLSDMSNASDASSGTSYRLSRLAAGARTDWPWRWLRCRRWRWFWRRRPRWRRFRRCRRFRRFCHLCIKIRQVSYGAFQQRLLTRLGEPANNSLKPLLVPGMWSAAACPNIQQCPAGNPTFTNQA